MKNKKSNMTQEAKLFNRNKWFYSLGGIGRDMVYTLVATFFLNYIQFSGLKINSAQFAVIGILLIAGRIWDAVNDPIMGTIIENTKSRWGKFKPWILIGAVFTAVIIFLMFNVRPSGWTYVVFFGIIYLLWEIAFTMNDISYWSMLPALSSKPRHRNSITTLAVVFAGVGAFVANGIIAFFTVGNAVQAYGMVALFFGLFLIFCQCLTVFGVKQSVNDQDISDEKITIRKMIHVIKNNDQLLWIILAMLLYNIGSGLFVALGYNFLYLELGYDGMIGLTFIVTFGVSNILIQVFYPFFVNRLGRKKLLRTSFIAIAIGYLLLLTLRFIPFLPMNIILVCTFGAIVFSGQAIFYMILTVNITNTVEYNQYKTGERNESIIFSLRPFMAKMASALQQGMVTLVLLVSGIYVLSHNISELEYQKNYFDTLSPTEKVEYRNNAYNRQVIFETDRYADLSDEKKQEYYDYFKNDVIFELVDDEYEMIINEAANKAFKDQATTNMRFLLRLFITVIPTILIFFSYYTLKKKFIIDEEMYNHMIEEIKNKKQTI